MALWLLRGGRHDQDVDRFLAENRVWIGWGQDIHRDFGQLKDKDDFISLLEERKPNDSAMKRAAFAGKIRAFSQKMKIGDWIVVPNSTKGAIHICEIASDYIFDEAPESRAPYHYRKIKWVKTGIPRSSFDQELLYAFGAQGTIYQIKKEDAQRRIEDILGGSKPRREPQPDKEVDPPVETFDYERLARDDIAKLIIRKFKGHGLEELVEGILKAQGYFTYRSPHGPDKGVDILAAAGPLGFGSPRICVQVKSTDGPVDSPTLAQLIGTMDKVQAEQGLLVSWSGFKSSVDKEGPANFFRIRLWDQETLINEFLGVYDKLDPDLRAEIPVKRIWSLAAQDEEE